MKGQFTIINMSGTAISAVLLVTSQFSSVQRLFYRALIRNARGTNLVLDQSTEAHFCSAITQLESEVSEENNTQTSYERAPCEFQLSEKIIVKNELSNENAVETPDEIGLLEINCPREVEKDTKEINENFAQTCAKKSSIQTTETTSIETEDADKTTPEMTPESTKPDESTTAEPSAIIDISKIEAGEPLDLNCFEAPKKPRKLRTRKPRESKGSELEAKSLQSISAELTVEQEFDSLLKIAETNAESSKVSQLVETQSTCTNVNNPEELSAPNGCPKNLAYYYQKPRPKQTPQECITCSNLITCVCLTSN